MAAVARRRPPPELVHLGAEAVHEPISRPRDVRLAGSGARSPPRCPGRPSVADDRSRAQGRAHSRSRGRSIQPRRLMKIGYEAPFGKVTVSGDPDAAAAASFSRSSVEKTPWPRYRGSVATLTGIARRVSMPSSAVRKKLIAATPTTSPSSTASETIPLTGRVPVEPPRKLLVGELRRADARAARRGKRAPPPSSAPLGSSTRGHPEALSQRTSTCVPTTVSLTERASQAPARTSSNVRDE